ncbi:MAG: CofH family radical SAM protein [Magnetococcales bacterium]|nr:CofH family radical SAM protein [Magnetococcales bacterium]
MLSKENTTPPEKPVVPEIHSRERLNRTQALEFLTRSPLGELMRQGLAMRKHLHPGNEVTWVFDTNPNHTNICHTRCSFCAFWRDEKDGYRLTTEELIQRLTPAVSQGATTVLIQGGHDPALTLDDWVALIRAIVYAFPQIHLHPFSPPEILFMAQQEETTVEHVLKTLWDEGIRTIPGGGAEILADSVRQRISPAKCRADEWLDLMESAHGMGFKTTATMMYGHIETAEDIVDHLLSLRSLQERTGGFSSFIPWSFKPGTTPLGRQIRQPAPAIDYPRLIALARLVLDNIPHIQSSWFSENMRAGQLGLLAGADDYGGLLFEENVLDQAGHAPKNDKNRILDSIRAMGFQPVQRDGFYRPIN